MKKNEEKMIEDFILYLYDGFSKFGDDKYAEHVFYIAVREVTRIIGERKNLKISKNALKILGKCNDIKDVERAKMSHPNKIIKEHKIPVKEFWDEFKTKKDKGEAFTRTDAERWLNEAVIAIITKEEDQEITKNGYMIFRHSDAYKKLGIELENI